MLPPRDFFYLNSTYYRSHINNWYAKVFIQCIWGCFVVFIWKETKLTPLGYMDKIKQVAYGVTDQAQTM